MKDVRRPLLCRLHIHRWGDFINVPVLHMGEYPWDKFQHVCVGHAKICMRCKKQRPRLFHKWCQSGWVVALPNQPYRPTRSETDAAARELLGTG